MTGHGCGKALMARHRVTSYANSIKLSHPPLLTWASRSRTAAARNLSSAGGCLGWHSSKRPLLLKPVIALFAAPVHAAYVGGLGECVGVGDGQRGRREIGARQIDLIVRL
jgi:hypothetical protein